MTAMFANARSNPLSNSGHLFEFKAGRSQLQVGSAPEKKKVVAEKTKGLVFIKQSNDQLMHFCWKNRETGGVVDDLIIFPGDTEFVRVKECPDGRVFMLKFKSSDERRLFWLQEPKTEGDADICTKVNDLLNKPPQVRAGGRGNASERAGITAAASGNHPIAALGSGVDSDEMGALGGLDQNQLMQLLQLMNSGARADSRSQNELQHSQEDVNQLSTILNNLRKNGGIASTSRATDVDLADVITGERVLETVRANNERLSPHLPTTEESPQAELEGTVRSPHFRQATDIFGHALQTGQLGPVLEQFSIGAEVTAAAATGNILEFAKKLTEAEQKGSGGSTDTSASGSQPPEPPANPPPSEDPVKEPEPKRGKTDDNMDLD